MGRGGVVPPPRSRSSAVYTRTTSGRCTGSGTGVNLQPSSRREHLVLLVNSLGYLRGPGRGRGWTPRGGTGPWSRGDPRSL